MLKVRNIFRDHLRNSVTFSLKDKECVNTVMEVTEQGISGTKSCAKASDEPVMKEDKVLAPASRRVREAAEALLSCIMEQVKMGNSF